MQKPSDISKLKLVQKVLQEARLSFMKLADKIMDDEKTALCPKDVERFQEASDRILGKFVRLGLIK